MAEMIEEIERRIEDIEKELVVLRAKLLGLVSDGQARPRAGSGDYVSSANSEFGEERIPLNMKQETPGVEHNRLGNPYSIKLVYPGFFRTLDVGIPYFTLGFPHGKERLAKAVEQGTMFFIYITSPMRRVIGLAEAMGPAEYRGDIDGTRPWVVTLEWVIGPKADGVSFAEVGLEVRGRPGDSVYSIPEDIGRNLIERLSTLCDLDRDELESLRDRFRV